MSDDEEYDEYEYDGDDYFWLEDADPDVADDLVGTATLDPGLQWDPCVQTEEYFSDWDEYTDDYYDEDPTAVRRLRALGAWPNTEAKEDAVLPAKRKKANASVTDVTSFQSVVWRNPTDEAEIVEIYTPGDGEKVALLKNWREVFRNAKPAIGRLRVRNSGSPVSDRDLQLGEQSGLGVDGVPSDVPSLAEDLCEDDISTSDTDTTPNKALYSAPEHASVLVEPYSKMPVGLKRDGLKYISVDAVEPSLNSNKEERMLESKENITQTSTTQHPVEQTPSASSRRGRKRKASVSLDEQPGQGGNPSAHTPPRTRSKRVAPSNIEKTASPAPRRSARHNK